MAKRLKFEVDDSGVQSSFERLKSNAKELSQDMMRDSTAMSSNSRLVISDLETQIRLMEKRNLLNKEIYIYEARAKYDAVRSDPKATGLDIGAAQQQFKKSVTGVESENKEVRLQTALLRELIDTTKEQARRELTEDRKGTERRVRAYESGKLASLSPEEKTKLAEQGRIIAEEQPAGRAGGAQWWQMAKGTFVGQQMSGMVNRLGGIALGAATAKDEVQVQSQMWSAIPFVGDFLAAASERSIESQEQRDIVFNKVRARTGKYAAPPDALLADRERAAITQRYTLKKGEIAMKAQRMLTEGGGGTLMPTPFDMIREGLPVMLGGVSDEEVKRRETIRGAWAIATAKKEVAELKEKNAVTAREEARAAQMSRTWSYTGAGIDQNEFIPVAYQLAAASGYGGDLANRTRNMFDLTKGRGLEQGAMMNMASMQRYDTARGFSGDGLIGNVSQLERIFEGGGIGRDRLGDSLNIVQSMNQAQISRGLESVNVVQTGQLKTVFDRLGGTFAHDAGTINAMDTALASPQNEFQQAMNYRIYSQQMSAKGKPSSYLGFKKWQEKGMYAEGLMGGRLGQIQDLFGDSEFAELAIKQGFGLKSYAQSEKVAGLSEDDFASVTGTAEGKSQIKGAAAAYATEREKSQADINEAFLTSMWSGIGEVFTKIGDSIVNKIAGSNFPFAKDLAASMKTWLEQN